MGACGLWQQLLCKAPDSWVSPWWEERIDRKHSTWTPVCPTLCFSHHHPPAHAWPWMGFCNMFNSSFPSGTIGSPCPVLLSWTAHSAPSLSLRPPKPPVNACYDDISTHTLSHVPQFYKYLSLPGATQASNPMHHTNSASNPVRSKDMCGVPQLLKGHFWYKGKPACHERWVNSSTMHCGPQRSAPGILPNPSPNTRTYSQAKEQLFKPWFSRIIFSRLTANTI